MAKEPVLSKKNKQAKEPSLLDALIPTVTLISLLSLAVYLFGEDAAYGPNQIALTVCGLLAAIIGLKNGYQWEHIKEGVTRSVNQSLGAIFILLAVGALVGTWVMCGTVATMISFGLKIISPSAFYPSAVIVCAIISGCIGSSYTTVGTIGVGLMGVAAGLGLPLGPTAGAIICGSYFGDKLSPLSDTTNLAPGVAGTDLYTHIRHMLYTTVPSLVITLIIFYFMGRAETAGTATGMLAQDFQVIDLYYHVGWHLLIPVFLVIGMAVFKVAPFAAIMIGALVGGLFAALFQPDQLIHFMSNPDLPRPLAMFAGAWKAMYGGFVSQTGIEGIDTLLSRGGMSSMLDVIWLVMCAMLFGGAMESTGLLHRLVSALLTVVRGTGSLVAGTIFTCIGCNVFTGDQYMSIVLPGRMYKLEYERRGLAPQNLSRALEDSATLTSPLIPWNVCGAFMAGTLGVPTIVYLPFCFLNILNPIISIFYGFTGISITKTESRHTTETPDGG